MLCHNICIKYFVTTVEDEKMKRYPKAIGLPGTYSAIYIIHIFYKIYFSYNMFVLYLISVLLWVETE